MDTQAKSNSSDEFDDSLAWRNAVVLAVANALSSGSRAIVIAVGGLAGLQLLIADKSLATLPVTAFIVGTAAGTIPAAMIMRRIGRRLGLQFGAALGTVGGAVAGYAILADSFWLLCIGMLISGPNAAFTQQYRFAAADTASPGFRPKAISYVLAGGVLAGVIGPQTVIYTTDMFAPFMFAGCFFGHGVLCLATLLILSFVNVPNLTEEQLKSSGRPLAEIMKTRGFLVASICGTSTFALMTLIMTATPLAMVACGLSESDSALAIQWHIIAMFAPSFFTGSLIVRYGSVRIMSIGLVLTAGCGIVALTGLEIAHFWIALILLGLGWNFSFIGATALLTDTYRPEERNKVQAANEFLIFGFVALASFLSGNLLHFFGWDVLNITMFPFIAICLAMLAWFAMVESRVRPA